MAAKCAAPILILLLGLLLPEARSEIRYKRIASAEKLFQHFFTKTRHELSTFPYCLVEQTSNNGSQVIVEDVNMTTNEFEQTLRAIKQAALKVEIKFGLINLVAVSEQDQTLRIELHTEIEWTDCRLAWSPEEFDMMRNISIPIERFRSLDIFIPLVFLREEMNQGDSQSGNVHVSLLSSGRVKLVRQYGTYVSCDLDLSMYPFDHHSCRLTFETLYNSFDVNLTYCRAETVALESWRLLASGRFTRNQLWELAVLPATKFRRPICASVDNDAGDLSHCSIDQQVFQVVLARHPTYQVINLFVPTFLCLIVSSSIYIIPSGTSDKPFLMLCILLSMFWFAFAVYDKMPDTGSTLCLMSLYYFICISITALNCVVCALTATVSASKVPVPAWLRRICQYCSIILLCDMIMRPQNKRTTMKTSQSEQQNDDEPNEVYRNGHPGDSNRKQQLADVNQVEFSKPEISWQHVAATFDRTYLIILLTASITLTSAFIIVGYSQPQNFFATHLSEEELLYADAQLEYQGDEDMLQQIGSLKL